MLEINKHKRLVRHADHHWMAQELISCESSFRRPVWKPITPLLSQSETEFWLSLEEVSEGVIALFKKEVSRIQ